MSSEGETLIGDNGELDAEQPWKANYKQSAYKLKQRNDTPQASSYLIDSEEIQGGDNKPYTFKWTIKMVAAELCPLAKKAGKKGVSNMISTITRDQFSKKTFLMHAIRLEHWK